LPLPYKWLRIKKTPEVTDLHLLLVMLQDFEGIVVQVLKKVI